MEDIEEKPALNDIPQSSVDKKKRKRKPKNKYKELNLQQKRASGKFDDEILHSQKQKNEAEQNKSEVPKDQENKIKGEKGKKQRNMKRKLSSETLGDLKSSKKSKLSDKVETNKVKNTDAFEITNSLSSFKKPNSQSTFRLNKLKMVLEKNNKRQDNSDESIPEKCETKNAEEVKKQINVSKAKKQKEVQTGSLRERVLGKLASARFRYINEHLYNMTSNEAVDMFKEDEEAFKVYHEGYSTQVAKWPVNPVDLMITFIDERDDNMVVADFGCGEAKIAQSVKNKKVHSFDLVSLNKHVTVCDISKVPLASGSVDIAVFCLSLMGTNLVNYLCEANRVLKNNGTLLVAEVVSRFEKVGEFVRKLKKMGFSLIKKDETNKMFLMFEFKKVGRSPRKDKLPKIELASCVYKKR